MKTLIIVLLGASLSALAQSYPNPRSTSVLAKPIADQPSPISELQQELIIVLAAQTQFQQRQIAMMSKAAQYGCTLGGDMVWQCPKPEVKKEKP